MLPGSDVVINLYPVNNMINLNVLFVVNPHAKNVLTPQLSCAVNHCVINVDVLANKLTNTVSYYIDHARGVGLIPILEANQNTFSNIRRVSIVDLNVAVIENL